MSVGQNMAPEAYLGFDPFPCHLQITSFVSFCAKHLVSSHEVSRLAAKVRGVSCEEFEVPNDWPILKLGGFHFLSARRHSGILNILDFLKDGK